MRDEIKMNDAELNRILAAGDEIVPSSGFATSVMAAVQREAAMNAPVAFSQPIPFPWAIALSGLLACLLMVGAVAAWINSSATRVAPSMARSMVLPEAASNAINLANLAVDQARKLPNLLLHVMQQAEQMGLGWLLVALLVSYVTVELSMSIAEWRHN